MIRFVERAVKIEDSVESEQSLCRTTDARLATSLEGDAVNLRGLAARETRRAQVLASATVLIVAVVIVGAFVARDQVAKSLERPDEPCPLAAVSETSLDPPRLR